MDDNNVNTYACNNATNSSSIFITVAKRAETIPIVTLWAMNVRLMILKMMMCPAVMFAKSRIISEKGFVKIPMISIGQRIR